MIRSGIVACLLAVAVVTGIVVIPQLVSSPEAAKCSVNHATEAGITNFVPNDNPDRAITASFYDQQGTGLTLADYSGKALLVNFWATWCAPCVAEMPALDRLQAILQGTGIEVLVVNEDRDGERVAPIFFEKTNLQNLDILLDKNQEFIRSAGVTGLPTTLFVDSGGTVVSSVLGDTEWDSPAIVDFVKTCFGYTKT